MVPDEFLTPYNLIAIFLMGIVLMMLIFNHKPKDDFPGLPWTSKPSSLRFGIWFLAAVPMLLVISYLPDGILKYIVIALAYLGFPLWATFGQPTADKEWERNNQIEKEKNRAAHLEQQRDQELNAKLNALKATPSLSASTTSTLSPEARSVAQDIQNLLKK